MSLCLNPNCSKPENPDNFLFCTTCGSELLLVGRYRITSLLSDKGGFGKTYEVTDRGTPKVLKVLINDLPKAVDLFQQEARVLTQLNHPGIPKGEGYFTYLPRDSKTPIHCLVMEKIEGLDLEEYIQQRQYRPIDQKLAFKWLFELTQILDEVHSQNFFNRDIKPTNIMLRPDGKLVLIDFGTVRQFTSTYIAKQVLGGVTSIVSGGYTPPEQIYSQAVPQSDFFSLGRTFVYLLTGKEPTDPEIYDPLNDELRWRTHSPNILPQFAEFIDVLMARSASKRPINTEVILQRLEEIEESFSHPQQSSTFPTSNSYYSQAQLLSAGWGKLPTNSSRTQAQSFTEDLGNGVFLEMVAIPGGNFLMGSSDTEKQRYNAKSSQPQHWVTVKPFYIGKFTVTQQQWRRVAIALPEVDFSLNPDPSYFKGNNLPVESISWEEAVEFCDRLSKKSGRYYILPSEAKWEYACRAGTTTPFHFGETITPDLANYKVNYSKGRYRQKTTSVGSFPPNDFGLYDMHGNVWEWCDDYWHDNYYGAPSDGSVWENDADDDDDDDDDKVLRGGSHFSDPVKCRCAYRGYYSPQDYSDNIGFRIACF